MDDALLRLTEAVKTGKRKDAREATEIALNAGTDPETVLAALTAGMDDVGKRFRANEIFVPEVLVAARAMKTSMELLEPALVSSGVKPKYTAVIGTVAGDLHDIGKNLVIMMLKGANYGVIDLGINVPEEKFIEAAREHNPDLICLSALLTTTMPAMKTTVEALRKEGVSARIMVGGAPITEAFSQSIGADGYATDAAVAVDVANQLVGA
ncbi:MAG: corrinoid protein [Opitutales bacterium]|nr:corrinoid protein [Opitutales bacterium]